MDFDRQSNDPFHQVLMSEHGNNLGRPPRPSIFLRV
jgi:hypothetical protein